ncbi:MAG TPA: M20/M25/M40 family metallo-hydrolase [Bacteroidia bacterium]|nr:M20/M25/M40 family metallo-hydrolase [Bacteroidia bacterium]
MKIIKRISLCTLVIFCLKTSAQNTDSLMIKKIYDEVLTHGECYQNLSYLCSNIGGRLSGSPQAAKAVEWGKTVMEGLNLNRIELQPVMVPHWVRGEKEQGFIINPKTGVKQETQICALGGSIATPEAGIEAEVIEVINFEDLEKLGKEKIKGKIVFYNRPMDATHIHTFNAYGKAVNQRWAGAMNASKFGAVATVTRSMGLKIDKFPHTGSMQYVDSLPKIPAVAISTEGAEYLSALIRQNKTAKMLIKTSCQTLPDTESYNVIGEWKGSEKPLEYIVVGGHLDAWDNGSGAHDDGAGCVQSMEVMRIFKAIGYQPKHSLRVVLFMNEENGLRGGKEYAKQAKEKKETHIAAIESDAGGFTPRGFSFEAPSWFMNSVKNYKPLLLPYDLHDLDAVGGGPDISPLKDQGVPLAELMPDSQRYFDYHHTADDTFDKVNKRELELGAAAMAALIYLIDNTEFH